MRFMVRDRVRGKLKVGVRGFDLNNSR